MKIDLIIRRKLEVDAGIMLYVDEMHEDLNKLRIEEGRRYFGIE